MKRVKKRKAFTLVEVITVIIVLAIIALITTPVVTGVINASKQKAFESIVTNIEDSAYKYSIYNNLGYSELYKSLELSEIKSKGYLENKDIIDPRNNKEMTGCVAYKWSKDANQYDFLYQEVCNPEELYPEVVINISNSGDGEWMKENIKFDLPDVYDSYKYCVSTAECSPSNQYLGTTTVTSTGKNLYVCVTGYMDDEEGSTECFGPFNVDPELPSLKVNSISTTSSTIVIDAECTDGISGYKSLQYSLNDGAYQNSGVFENLTSGTYKVNVKCMDIALNESIYNVTKTTASIVAPTIEQYSQTPSDTAYATKRVMRITYDSTNVQGPKYYYSLDGITWTQLTSGITQDVTFTSNGKLYAKTVDAAGNTASASTYTITDIDTSAPSASVSSISVKTDRATVVASCSDTQSGITKYEFSKDGGSTYTSTGTTATYTFTELTQTKEYTFKVRCTNGSLITKESDTKTATTSTIVAPTIAQQSQSPSSGTYATQRIIRITYTGTNIQNPKYYYSLDGTTWTQVTSATKDLTFTSNGKVYAKTTDDAENTKSASTYTVANIDTDAPTISVSVSGKVATLTLKDNIGVVGYGVNQSSSTAPTFTEITSTSSTSKTWTASSGGTYYAWVKDVSGRTAKVSFTIANSAFNYAATATTSTTTYAATGTPSTSTYTATSTDKCDTLTMVKYYNSTYYHKSGSNGCWSGCDSSTLSGCLGLTADMGGRNYCCTIYSCPNGGTQSNGVCTVSSTTYSCPNGGTLSGTTCTVTTTTYSCPNGGTLNGTTCEF